MINKDNKNNLWLLSKIPHFFWFGGEIWAGHVIGSIRNATMVKLKKEGWKTTIMFGVIKDPRGPCRSQGSAEECLIPTSTKRNAHTTNESVSPSNNRSTELIWLYTTHVWQQQVCYWDWVFYIFIFNVFSGSTLNGMNLDSTSLRKI